MAKRLTPEEVAKGKKIKHSTSDNSSKSFKPTNGHRTRLATASLELLDEKKKRIASEFEEWAANIRLSEMYLDKKYPYRIYDFRRKVGLKTTTWKNWVTDKKSSFAEDIIEGKEALGTHLWAAAVQGCGTPLVILRDLHHYSEEFRENDAYEDKRKIAIGKEVRKDFEEAVAFNYISLAKRLDDEGKGSKPVEVSTTTIPDPDNSGSSEV